MKAILGFVLTVVVLVIGGLYISYGEVEPCKVLSVERERHAGLVDQVTSQSTDDMSTTECISGLLDSWADRLKSD